MDDAIDNEVKHVSVIRAIVTIIIAYYHTVCTRNQ